MKTLDERLHEVQLQVHHLSRHVERVIATSNELEQACAGRPFNVNGFAAWDALLSMRDGIFLDLVSWSKSLYMAGGLLKSIAGGGLPVPRRRVEASFQGRGFLAAEVDARTSSGALRRSLPQGA